MTTRKGFARHTIIYGAGIVISRLVSFAMLPVYTRYLTPADYGIMALLDMTMDIVSIVAGAKLAGGVYRFYHKAPDSDERGRVISTATVLLGASFAVFALLTALFATPVSRLAFGTAEHALLVRVGATSLALQGLLIVPLAFLQLQQRSTAFTAVTTVKLFLQLGLSVLFLVHFRMGILGVLTSTLVANVIIATGMLGYTMRHAGLHFSPSIAWALVRFGVPLMGTQVATFTSTFVDRYFINSFVNAAAVGLYSIAYQFGFLLVAVGYTPFAMLWEPERFRAAEQPDRDARFQQALVFSSLLLATVAVGIGIWVEDVLRVMATPEFRPAARIVPFLLVAYSLQGWSAFMEGGILIRERTGLIAAANWAAALASLTANFLLVPRFGTVGAATATILAFGIRAVLIHAVAQRLYYIPFDWRPVRRLIAAAAATIIVAYQLPLWPLAVSVPVRLALLGLYVLVVWQLEVLPKAEVRTRLLAFRARLAGS